MAELSEWSTSLGTASAELVEGMTAFAPRLAGAVVVLVAGWLIARLLRGAAIRLGRVLERMFHHLARRRGETRPPVSAGSPHVLASLVFWLTILVFLTLAADVLGLESFGRWLDRVAAYLPTLLAGVLIVAGGFLVSILVKDLVIAATAPLTTAQRMLLGRGMQIVIFVTAIIIGADQIGVEVRFLVIMTSVAVGAALGGLALAFSLGAQPLLGNLIAGQQLRQHYHVGQSLRVAGFEGRVVALTSTGLTLDTADGQVTLPARLLHEQPVLLVRDIRDNE